MRSLIAALLLLFGSPMIAQEHAPTADVCRADSAVWNAEVMNHNPEASKTKLSYDELAARQNEMHSCRDIDPARVGDSASIERINTYTLLESLYTNEIERRAVDFIFRHNLGKQFLAEDAAGTR